MLYHCGHGHGYSEYSWWLFDRQQRTQQLHTVLTIEGWQQVGSELQGPTTNSTVNFGTSVAISGDGEWIAITAPGVDDQSVTPNEVNVGQVLSARPKSWSG
jgi:hypothetical protein